MQQISMRSRRPVASQRPCAGSSTGVCAPAAAAAAHQHSARWQQRRQQQRQRRSIAAGAGGNGESAASKEADLEDAVERFMRQQAEKESGAAFAKTQLPDQIIGGDVIDEEEAKAYCREVVAILKALKTSRDMSSAEAKLVIMIEDPAAAEKRKLGIEDERGVSRDEMAAALDDIVDGRVPKDRIALKCLFEEMRAWPL